MRVKLTKANCAGQALTVLPITDAGKQVGPRASGRIPQQDRGVQYARIKFDTPMNAEQLKSVRISIDPGNANVPTDTTTN